MFPVCAFAKSSDIPYPKLRNFIDKSKTTVSRSASKVIYEASEYSLQIEYQRPKSKADFIKETQDRIQFIENLYQESVIPYTGQTGGGINCNSKYLPKASKNLNSYILTGELNKKKAFGACVDSQIFYSVIMAFHYDNKSKTAILTKLIVPKSKTSDFQFYFDEIKNFKLSE